MKLVILNKNDGKGGAARAASMWHRTMLANNINSKLLVENSFFPSPTTVAPRSKLSKAYNQLKSNFDDYYLTWKHHDRQSTPWGLNILPTGTHSTINHLSPDVVNLHWISQEMISWNEIAKIEAPIVWTMHDMWALTGGCHYAYGCQNYLTHCGNCPQLKSSKERDISYKVFDKKRELLRRKKISIITSSQWLHDCFKSSPLYKETSISIVPNPINTNIFKPLNKEASRKILNLPSDKKLILFLAFSATSDTRKGVQFFPEMLEHLSNIYNTNELELVIVGASDNNGSIQTEYKLNFFGVVNDDWTLALLYSACDTMVAPSTEENLSSAVMESMACATPVVAFNIGGMPDMIKHKTNGYLATAFDAKDLAKGLQFVMEENSLGSHAREHVMNNYTSDLIFRKVLPIYQTAIDQNK